jgi:uncharacterized protein YgiM (DUF1202 family)
MLSVLVCTFFIGFPVSSAAEGNAPSCYIAEAKSDGARLRSAGSLKSKVVAQLKKGDLFPVEAISGDESWAKVSEGPRARLFVSLSAFKLRFRSDVSTCRSAEGPAEVISNRVNVRSAPSESSAIAGQVNIGDPLTVSPAEARWLKISFPEDYQGKFVHSDFVQLRLPDDQ